MKIEPHGMGPVAFIPETAYEAYTLQRLSEWSKIIVADISKPNEKDLRYVFRPAGGWSQEGKLPPGNTNLT